MRRGVLCFALSFGLALGACGDSDRGAAAKVVDRHLEAIADGNPESACRDLTPKAKRVVVVSVNATAQRDIAANCVEAYGAIAANLTEETQRALRRSDLDVLVGEGGTATVDSSATTGEIELTKAGSDWKISRINFGS